MLNFLSYHPQSVRQGELPLAQQMVDAYQKKRQSGFLEIEWSEARHALLLFSDGQMMGVNVLEDNTCSKITYEQLSSIWKEGAARLRGVQAGREAVRAVQTALDWYPPNRAFSVTADDLARYRALSQEHQQNGLFHLVGADFDGYIFLVDGVPQVGETVRCSAAECLTGEGAYEKLLADAAPSALLEIYAASLTSASYQQINLRLAFAQLLLGMLNRYASLVGEQMGEALAVSLNQLASEKNYHLLIVQGQFADTHVFASNGAVFQAYRFLFRNLLELMSEMIGKGLAHSLAFEVFRSMPPKKQEILRESPLMVMIISSH